MKFKKLTLAAAISIGLASVATVGAFAGGCGCNVAPMPIVSPACCPVQCAPACPAPCAPACACPLEEPCACQPACPCEPECAPACAPACPIVAPCCDKPACGLAPSPCGKTKEGIMHYAFPENIFSGCKGMKADPFNIGFATNNGVMTTKGCSCGDTSNNCGCDCGSVVTTGAAACMPCISNGAVVDRECCGTDTGSACNCGCNDNTSSACPVTIQTQSSLQALKKSLVPFQVPSIAGAACPTCPATITSAFCDVPDGYWANCDINKLVAANVIAGYPDRTFKPTLPVSRAEFASLIANGLELSRCAESCSASFCDVPALHWANNSVQRSVGAGYMAGYPDCTFKPGIPISRAEAITTIAKSFKCELTDCEADQILSQYQDACKVPAWAKMSVAKALKSNLLKDTPNPCMINPCEDASRADVASMLSQARIALCIDKPTTTACECQPTGCACENNKTFMETCETVDIPTLKVIMKDQLSSANSDVGDHFLAETVDPMTINGVCYPACSKVRGMIVDIQRPTSQCDGAMKIAFNEIQNGDCKVQLPKQILNAQVDCNRNQNWFSRAVQMPFTLVGGTLGIAGRTVGGIIVNASNAAETVTNNVGIGTGELFQFGKSDCTCCKSGMMSNFGSAFRSYKDAVVALALAPVDVARTSISGATGVLQNAGNEIGYLVNPDGKCVSSINMNERVTFAFGVNEQPAAAAPCPCEQACPCQPACPCEPACPSVVNPCD